MMLDIFNQNAFNLISLTDSVNKMKFVPGYLSAQNLFNATSVSTTTIVVEEKNNTLSLVAPSPRGGVGSTTDNGKRAARSFIIPHFEMTAAVQADEVQGLRAFGSEDVSESVMRVVAEKSSVLVQNLAYTAEANRLGAVKGIVTYADNSTFNLFTEFGVTQPTEVAFNFAGAAAGDIRKKCATILRSMAVALDGVPFTGVTALCSDSFFDDLISNAEVRATYLNSVNAADLRSSYVEGGQTFGSFQFGGINFVNYRGTSSVGITADKANLFPTGVGGLFRTVYAPADYVETVNTLGQPLYSNIFGDQRGKSVTIEVQSNALHYCTRPAALFQARRGS